MDILVQTVGTLGLVETWVLIVYGFGSLGRFTMFEDVRNLFFEEASQIDVRHAIPSRPVQSHMAIAGLEMQSLSTQRYIFYGVSRLCLGLGKRFIV